MALFRLLLFRRLVGSRPLVSWAERKGLLPTSGPGGLELAHQPRLRQARLRAGGDPVAVALDASCWGGRRGLNEQMPRTPAGFGQKVKGWRHYEDGSSQALPWAPNHETARERCSFLEDRVAEEVEKGRRAKMKFRVAKARNGEKRLVGASGVVDEGSNKLRLIHDGSFSTPINHKARTRDQIPGRLGLASESTQEWDPDPSPHPRHPRPLPRLGAGREGGAVFTLKLLLLMNTLGSN